MIKFELLKGEYPLIMPNEPASAYASGASGGHPLTAEEAIAVSLIGIHNILISMAQKLEVET